MYDILFQKFQKREFSEIISLAQANNITPSNDPRSAHILAAAFFSLGQFSESIEILTDLETSLGNDNSFLSLYGAALRRAGNFSSSKSIFKRALEQFPDNAHLKNNYANLLIDMNEYSEAYSILKDLVDSFPEYDDAVANLARVKALLALPAPKVKAISAEGSINKGNTRTLDVLLDPLLLAFDADEVRDHGRITPVESLKNAIDNPDLRAIGLEKLKLAQKSVSENNPIFALQLCSQSYKQLGCDSNIFDCASDAYLRLKRYFETEISILHALSISGPSMKHYINLTSLASMRCDFKLAEYYLNKAVCLDSTHPALEKLRKYLNDRIYSKVDSPFQFENNWKADSLSQTA